MSRVGKKIIDIPSDVTVTIEGNTVSVKGPKGELSQTMNERMTYKQDENTLEVVRPTDSQNDRTVHGTTRALINNMILGVKDGYKKTLELVGVGYRAQMQGNDLVLNVGYSHTVEFKAEDGITFGVDKNTTVTVEGISKEQVGAIASNIRSVRPPEPYKGKGIRYQGEYVRRKEGKTGK
ncbi:50S ribosomal protein L6 [Staphylococcus ureilyticus]|uniref:50S ribosomal protein L6 n=1 Tax=Staphylococcus TaxID=1279 RepID=UPI0009468F13|nr:MULTISPECIES: 50S ribosomal protein L6 [Staphylococcus]MDT3982483.1 50S ribosomal protein L6 [Staphylococcus ureilyticus]OLF33250.1 50S ribosomal protein L6 [Staphylococcus sp. 47.1]PIS62300.1 50S ribosomal protein L6 [Corynebacterium striatum]